MRRASALPALAVFGAILLATGLPRAYGEDPASDDALFAIEARKNLIAEAASAERADGRGALAAMRRSLVVDREFAAAYEPKDEAAASRLRAFEATLAERVLLLGEPVADNEAQPGGALGAAARLSRWLVGKLPCDVVLTDREPPGSNPAAYAFPPKPTNGATNGEPARPAPDGGDGTPAGPGKDDAPKDVPTKDDPGKDGATKEGVSKNGVPKDAGTPEGAGEAASPVPAQDPRPAAVPKTIDEIAAVWARGVRDAEGGAFPWREIRPALCADVELLLRAAERKPVYVHESLRDLQRRAISRATKMIYNLPSVALRRLQARERTTLMQADRPEPSLVDQAMVREKDALAQQFGEALAGVERERAAVLGTLDEMVFELEAWKTQAALLATEIDEHRRLLAEKAKDAAKDEGDGAPGKGGEDAAARAAREAAYLPLRLAQARESLATLEIRLLLNTAARASARLELLEGLERSLGQELREAEELRARYAESLLRLRTARRIDRLERDLRRLRRWQAPRDRVDVVGATPQRRAAYTALIALHEIALEAVRQRRAMAVSVRAVAPGATREADAAPKPERTDADAEPAVERGPRLSAAVANPATASWDVKFLELARRELLQPELREAFDARLVAQHYEEASAEVGRLLRAQRHALRGGDLQQRFTAATADAEASLRPLEGDPLAMRVRRLPAMLSSAVDDFQAALEGITEQRDRNRERLAALLGYQRKLERQGTRSLLIRVDRTHRDPYFGDVMRDTRAALESAGAWASFQGESHLGDWLGRSWVKLLLALLVFLAAWLGSKGLRRVVDGRIDAIVADLPDDVGASVREERERARQRRRHSDKAAAAITDDDVLQVPVEDLVATTEDRAAPAPGDAGIQADDGPDDADDRKAGS